jgi:hypothetical protein
MRQAFQLGVYKPVLVTPDMGVLAPNDAGHPSQAAAHQSLTDLLKEFDIPAQETGDAGPDVRFEGAIPAPSTTHSQKLNLTLVGSIPALANAVTAAKIFEARGGQRQTVSVDLRRGHNYIDPGVGMTPTVNGQEITMDVVAGNPFINNIFETKDGRYAVLSAVYVDLAYKWTALLGCSMAEQDVREKVKQWSSAGMSCLADHSRPDTTQCKY